MLCLSTSYADCIRYCADTGYLITLFASARPTRIASRLLPPAPETKILCLSTSYADCIPTYSQAQTNTRPLPQHVLRGLHLQLSLCLPFRRCFASARPTRIASQRQIVISRKSHLCLSTSYADCIDRDRKLADDQYPLPQHVLRGLHLPAAMPYTTPSSFASARPTRIASPLNHTITFLMSFASARPTRIASE